MVDVLVILDGASEPPDRDPSSLALARMPELDRLRTDGEVTHVDHVSPGLPVGSETAIATLLGWRVEVPVDRGALEAAARRIEPASGERVWRVDVVDADGGRAAASATPDAAAELRAALPEHTVHEIGGHRLLISGPPPLPPAARLPGLRAWSSGAVPPRILDDSTVVIGAPGAAIGLARLLGAKATTPAGATGRPGSDLGAKRRAALEAIVDGAGRVVVHVGGPDEAAHERDRAAKISVLEDADRELIGPLAEAVLAVGGQLTVCPDHGCDPTSGEHVRGPVPCVAWRAMVHA